jgi:hypothetical protein
MKHFFENRRCPFGTKDNMGHLVKDFQFSIVNFRFNGSNEQKQADTLYILVEVILFAAKALRMLTCLLHIKTRNGKS